MEKVDLTEGKISKEIIKVTIPLVLASVIQIIYNLTDMFFLGQLGSDAVAAAGTAGFYFWICITISFLAKTGTEIEVARASGENDHNKVTLYAKTGIQMAAIIGIIYFLITIIFKSPLINFFNLDNQDVVTNAIIYLKTISFAFPATVLGMTISGILNGTGNTKQSFKINAVGVILNVILDPIFIFGFNMGVFGAALASAIGSIVNFIIFIIYLKKHTDILTKENLLKVETKIMKGLFKLGLPVGIQNFTFAFISMFVARIIGNYGAVALAVQRLGSQIESVGWMVGVAARTTIVAFIGQNLGAKKWHRLLVGYGITMKMMLVYAVIVAAVFYFGAESIMNLFFAGEVEAVIIGTNYLQIMFFIQIFVALNSVNSGALNAFESTKLPSYISMLADLSRIILAIFLGNNFGLNGVWWALASSEVLKGIATQVLFVLKVNKIKELNIKDIFKRERSLAWLFQIN